MYLNSLKNRATYLGYFGVIPFLGVFLLLTNFSEKLIVNGVQSYAAVILTFIGAIHWGRAIYNKPDVNNTLLLTISVIPSLPGWISLLLPPTAGLPLLILSFLALPGFDYKQYNELIWFQKLRIKLTFIVCGSLIFCLLAIIKF